MSAGESAYELFRVLPDEGPYARVRCPDCRGPLAIHQPDERLPDRLLGTCRSCLAWFLLDADGVLTFRLPDSETPKVAGTTRWAGGASRSRMAPEGVPRLHGAGGRGGNRPARRDGSARPEEKSGTD